MRFLAVLPLLVLPTTSVEATTSVELVETHPAARADLAEGLQVLHAWDARRARAWSRVDAAALRSLYVGGSEAARADLRLLRAYAARGLVVRRLVTQVFAVRVLHRDATTFSLRVVDRVAGGEVVHEGRASPLGSSPPVTRTVTFRRVEGGWRVAGVSGSVRGPRGARH